MTLIDLEWVAVVAIGALIGAAELVSRYRDAPWCALRCAPGMFYMTVNAAASAAAFALIRITGWTFGMKAGTNAVLTAQVLIAATGAMALFRSRLFILRVGDADVSVGPRRILDAFLTAADRAVDRLGAPERSRFVRKVMKDVSYEKAKVVVPTYCLALLRNTADDEQKQLSRALKFVDTLDTDAARVLLLGVTLMNFFGRDIFATAVEALRDEIQFNGDESPRTVIAASASRVR